MVRNKKNIIPSDLPAPRYHALKKLTEWAEASKKPWIIARRMDLRLLKALADDRFINLEMEGKERKVQVLEKGWTEVGKTMPIWTQPVEMPLDGSSPFEAPDGDLLADALRPAGSNGTGERKIHLGPFPKPKVKPLTDDRAPWPEPEDIEGVLQRNAEYLDEAIRQAEAEPRAPVVTGAEDFNPVRQPIDWDKPNLITVEVDAPTMKQLLDQAQGYQEIQAVNSDLHDDCGDCDDCITARVLGKLRAMNPRLGDLIDVLELEEQIRQELKL